MFLPLSVSGTGHQELSCFSIRSTFVSYNMDAKKVRYNVIRLSEWRRQSEGAVIFGEELRPCRWSCHVGVFVITLSSPSIDSCESLTTRVSLLRLKQFGSVIALVVFVVYAPTFNHGEEELEAFYMKLEKIYKQDLTCKVIACEFNLKIVRWRFSGELHI